MDNFEDRLQSLLSNPEALAQVMSLAGSLRAAAPEQQDTPREAPPRPALPPGLTPADDDGVAGLLGGLDPKLLAALAQLAGGGQDDRRLHLLNAMKPYVRAERCAKIDSAMQILRLARLARQAFGLLGGD